MAIDMSQFYQVFFEESAEHLADMERMLLEVDVDAPNIDDLNAIFRAAHSIKGGSGTFGFTDMTEVTHVLENLLDRLRKGEMQPRTEMIDAFLEAADVLKDQLSHHVNGSEANREPAEAIIAKLQQLTAGDANIQPPQVEIEAPHTEPAVAPTETAPPEQKTAPSKKKPSARRKKTPVALPPTFHISIELSPKQAKKQESLDNLMAELSSLGTVEMLENATPVQGKKKKKKKKDQPARWQFRLNGNTTEEAIADVFAFIAAPEQIHIDRDSLSSIESGDTASDEGYGFFDEIAAAPEDDTAYGLFTDTDAPATEEDPGFGFFDEIPAAESDEGYGFFDTSSPEAVPEPDPGYGFFQEPATAAPSTTESEGYGFFTEIVPPPPAPVIAKAPPPKPAAASSEATSIRVSVEKVDQLINLVGELVITQAMLAQTAMGMDATVSESLLNGLTQLERNTRDLQESVMSIRMMPISFVFNRFPRVVRDLASKLNKQVELVTVGENTELDKGLIEKIADPLTHLVRNSLDHGIESPEKRTAAGKNPKGTITLSASHQGGSIVIEVSDDGAGLNRERILSKAIERGLAASEDMPDQDVWQLIFEPGFSTAEVVTDVSGRGVGMDVVKRNITEMGGSVEIESIPGFGTKMTVRLPLTLAILDGMTISVGESVYVIPLSLIIETLQPLAEDVKTVTGQGRVVHVRGEYLPLIALHEIFSTTPQYTDPTQGVLVMIEDKGKKAAVFVDALVGQQQVVIKSLETNFRKVPGISGATIMGDGRVALIIDVPALIKMGSHHA